jgi:hypothetical protein
MLGFATVLFLVSPIAFLAGLVNPKWVLLGNKRTRLKSSIVYSGVFVASLILTAFTAPTETKQADRSVPQLSPSNVPTLQPSISPEAQTQQPSPSPLSQPSVLASPQTTKRISVTGAGLGDTRGSFEKVYGHSIGDNRDFGRYQADYVHASFAEDTVMSIQLQFGKTDKNRRTKGEAVDLARVFLPGDAVKVKEWQPESEPNSYAIHYESQQLANAFPKEWQEVFWEDGVKPGSFLVILTHDEGNTDSVFSVSVDAGDPNNP